MTNHILDEAQASTLLEPVKALLVSELHGAFGDWTTVLRNNPGETGGLGRSARCRFVHDRWVFRLKTAMASGKYPTLRLDRRNQLNLVVVGDKIALKLKKLDPGLRSRNIQTNQTVAFDNQELVVPSEFGRMTNATSGYVLDEHGAVPVQIVVVCWDGETKVWDLRLDGEAGGVTLEIGAANPSEAPDKTRTRIVPHPEPREHPGGE